MRCKITQPRKAEKTESTEITPGKITAGKHGFPPGVSGNPLGRPKGALNKTTLAALAILEGQAKEIMSKAVALALSGDPAAIRICVERLVPPCKDRPLRIDLPTIGSAADILTAERVIIDALAGGNLGQSQAFGVMAVLDLHRQTLEATELEQRLSILEAEAKRKGDSR